ncbi:hypothetical protein [Vibrio sp. 1CM23M]|uniref:hypothetical protein n=1 Tax=Vibrio sp. 1CM23M TaxID=2929164 RepID=UPI0020BF2567|nr:hypothetical protein [Vibrio sp. 1CM23M]MCK8072435.1 hypothetical protein [Vibrio sp. 1CM23M]
MWKKILLVVPLLLLQGCDDESGINEPTDKGCYDDFQDLTYDTSMLFNACKSKDIYAEMNNVYQYRTEHEMVEEPLFEANRYITEDQAIALNATQVGHFQYDKQLLKMKNDYYEMSFEINFLILSIAFGFIFFGLKNRQTKFSSASIVGINLLLVCAIGNVLLNSNEIERNVNAAVMKGGNFMFRLYSTATLEEHKTNELDLQVSAKDEALSDIMALYNLNICLSNNRNSEMYAYEQGGNAWGGVEEYALAYSDKNKVVYPQKETGRGAIKIMMNKVGNYETVGYVRFKNCGTLSFDVKHYNNGFSDLLAQMKFNEAVIAAVKSDNFESGWNSLQGAFDEKYTMKNDESRNVLTTLLIAYLHEYKKQLLLNKITTDYANADTFYKNITKAACGKNNALALESNGMLDSFIAGESPYLNRNECLLFGDSSITKAQETPLHEINEKDLIQSQENLLINASHELVKADYEKLAMQYDRIGDFYASKIKELYDVDDKIIELLNEGWSSAGKLQRIAATDNAHYKELFKELQYIADFDYSNIYPYYTHRDKIRVKSKDLYTYDFVEQFFPKSNLKTNNLLANNVATTKMKNRYNKDLSVESQDDVEIERSFKEMIIGIGKSAEKISCANSVSIDDCLRSMKGYDGVETWDAVSRDLLASGSETYLWGLKVDISGITMTAFADYVLGARKVAASKGKKGKKFDVGTSDVGKLLASWGGKSVSFVGQSAQWIGGMAMLLGSLMQMLLTLVELINQYVIISITMRTSLLPFVLIAGSILSLLVSISGRHYQSATLKAVKIMTDPIVSVVFSITKIFAIWSFVSALLWSVPYINATVTYSLAAWLPDSLKYLIKLIGLTITVPIVFYATYEAVKKVNHLFDRLAQKLDVTVIAGGAIQSIELVVKGAMAKGVMGIGKRSEMRRNQAEAKRIREMANNKSE